jgi:hypothetical protein
MPDEEGITSQAASAADWFVLSQGQESGPFTVDELKARAAAGMIGPWDLVRNRRCKWTPARQWQFLAADLPTNTHARVSQETKKTARLRARLSAAREFVARMPRRQKIIWAGIACLAVLALYVPWKTTWGTSGEAPAGYHFLFAPPPVPNNRGLKVDVTRMVIPMAVAACITAAAAVFAAQKPRKQD